MFNRLTEYHLNPPEDRVYALCDYCNGEIYSGEDYYDIDGDMIHGDCFYKYCQELYNDCKREADCREIYADRK